jgi:hypothetical protein
MTQPLSDINRELRGIDLTALELDREALMLRPSWWPSPSPGVSVAESMLLEQRKQARVVDGVWITGKGEGPVESKELIGGDPQDDNGWVCMVLQTSIDGRLPDMAPDDQKPNEGEHAFERLQAGRLNNLGCARIWTGDWAGAQTALTAAKSMTPPSVAGVSDQVQRRWGFGSLRGGLKRRERSDKADEHTWPGAVAADNLKVLAGVLRAYIDVLHARADQQRLRSQAV